MAYNLLIVDDSNIVRRVIKKTLTLTDIAVGQVFEAENGADALNILSEHWVDLVFLDINMPVMNGVEFLEKVRGSDEHRDLPVVIVSTEGSQERIQRLKDLGVEAYLRKPVSPESLGEAVSEVLGVNGDAGN